MSACPSCDFVAKSLAGLARHRWSKHRADDGPGQNKVALEHTLGALTDLGRLETVDAAAVQALRSIAAALDLNPFNDRMWREYREALRELAADDSDDDGIEALLAEMRTSVRDPQAP